MIKKLLKNSNEEDLDKKLVFSHREKKIPSVDQFKLLPKLLKTRELWVLRIAIAVVLIVGSAMFGKMLASNIDAVPLRGGVYREAVVGTPKFINSILEISDVDKDLSRLVYSSLLEYNNDGELVGDLAESFSIEEEGLAVRFTLKNNVKWHDGEMLTAQDVLFTLEAIKNSAWRSPLWRTFQDTSIEQQDENTVIVKSRAFVSGFADLFTFGILPKHIWENVDPETARLAVWNTKPVGSGPFKFESLAKSRDGILDSYKLTRNKDYYKGEPYIKEFTLVFFPDFESALGALRAHTVDGVSFIPARLREKVPGSGVKVFDISFPRFTSVFFNARNNSALLDKSVRRALEKSINRQDIATIVKGAEVAVGPFLKDHIGFAKTIEIPSFNIDEAKEILINGGWKQEEGKWTKDGNNLSITITIPDEGTMLRVADRIKQSWEELGIQVQLEAASRISFEQDVLKSRSYEVLVFSVVTGRDSDPFSFWHSSQMDDPGLNFSSISSRKIDVALERGRSTTNSVDRLEAYLEFQNLLLEEIPSVVLYSSSYTYVTSKRLRGFELSIITRLADRFNNVEGWFVRSRPGWK